MPELPAQFSMSTYQDPIHHFKVICQLYVHLAVQRKKNRRSYMDQSMKSLSVFSLCGHVPDISPTDDYFAVPLQVFRRKLDALRDTVASSVWRTGFKKSLARYPQFELTKLDFTVPGCDACHLGARISTLVGRLSGQPYDSVTFKVGFKRLSSSGQLSFLLL